MIPEKKTTKVRARKKKKENKLDKVRWAAKGPSVPGKKRWY